MAVVVMASKTVLSLKNVSVVFRNAKRPALDNCSFNLNPGDRVALIGVNGSGKTTLLQACVGLLPFRGTIQVLDIPISPSTLSQARQHLGFLQSTPQNQLLFPRVVDDVAFSLIRRGMSAEMAAKKATAQLSALGAQDLAQSATTALSHGQCLRVALAGTLVTRPELLLLDEPASGLDPFGKIQLADVLAHLPTTMIVATHDPSFVQRFCTHYILLEEGNIIASGDRFSCLPSSWRMLFQNELP